MSSISPTSFPRYPFERNEEGIFCVEYENRVSSRKKDKQKKNNNRDIEVTSSEVSRPIFQTPRNSPRVASLREMNNSPSADPLRGIADEEDDTSQDGEDLPSQFPNIAIEHTSENESSTSTDGNSYRQRLQDLKDHYMKWRENVEDYEQASKYLFKPWEYINDNKIATLSTIKRFAPEYHDMAEALLKNSDSNFRWTESTTHFLISIMQYSYIREVQETLNEYEKMILGAKSSGSSSSDMNRNIRKNIYKFQQLLNNDQEKARSIAAKKFGCITAKALTSPFERVAEISSKNASRVTKSAYNVYKSYLKLLDISHIWSLQIEWLFYLQPVISVNIFSDETAEQIQFQQERSNSQAEFYKDVQDFFKFLKDPDPNRTIEEIKAKFQEIGSSFALPSTVEEFRTLLQDSRFQNKIGQEYFYCKGQRLDFLDYQATNLLNKNGENRNKRVDAYLAKQLCDTHLPDCKDLSFKEINNYFKKLHIRIDLITELPNNNGLTLPPTTKKEWDVCIQDGDFLRALAGQWIDHQDANVQLIYQTTRQAILTKLNIEKKFLLFRVVQTTIEIASSLIQGILSFCNSHAQMPLSLISAVVEVMTKDFAKFGIPGLGIIHVFHPLYTNINFKFEYMLIKLAEHFFAIPYKPNEYSLESYLLALQTVKIKFAIYRNAFSLKLKQTLLWINIRLIENCVMGLARQPLTEDERYQRLTEVNNNHRLNLETTFNEVKGKVKELVAEDAKLMIHPGMKKPDDDPFQIIAETFQDTNIENFPSHIVEFFEEHLDIVLANQTQESFKDHLVTFFSQKEGEFLKSFSSTRFHYLKI